MGKTPLMCLELSVAIDDLGFQKPYRILKTTFKNLDEFQSYYPGTEIPTRKAIKIPFVYRNSH